MDIFKEYPGELCTVGRVNGLWWTTSTEAETDCFIRRCSLQCSYYRVYSKLLVKTDLVEDHLFKVYSTLKSAAKFS